MRYDDALRSISRLYSWCNERYITEPSERKKHKKKRKEEKEKRKRGKEIEARREVMASVRRGMMYALKTIRYSNTQIALYLDAHTYINTGLNKHKYIYRRYGVWASDEESSRAIIHRFRCAGSLSFFLFLSRRPQLLLRIIPPRDTRPQIAEFYYSLLLFYSYRILTSCLPYTCLTSVLWTFFNSISI